MFVNIAGRQATSSITDKATADVDVQPNALDLRVDRIFKISNQPFIISETEKHHRGSMELFPDWYPEDFQAYVPHSWWKLFPGSYEIVMEGKVKMGPDEVGWVIPRSTLNRNGLFLTSGLYDSGYHGTMAACLHITGSAYTWIQRGTRVGQFIVAKAEALKMYNGSYGLNADGSSKPDETKLYGTNTN